MTSTDMLTGLFETLRLSALLSFVAELGAGDAIAVPAEPHVVRFHFVHAGECAIELADGRLQTLRRGELALIPHGAAQVVRTAHARRTTPVALEDLIASGALRAGVLRRSDAPVAASLVCGYCRFDTRLDHPVLDALPAVLVIGRPGADPRSLATCHLIGLEADRLAAGADAILTRLVEVAFVQAVRELVEAAVTVGQEPGESPSRMQNPGLPIDGFLGALADRQLAQALAAIHQAPAERWTLATLALEAGLSRTVFAEAFARQVGQSPLAYLTRWRMTLAHRLLARRGLSVDTIAERVGYRSPAAFSRRFKACHGMSPGACRRILLTESARN